MDQLFYFNKSVGKGINEHVFNYNMYDELNKIHDWRRILSNFYSHEFIYDDKIYNSVEHAFQSKKIELVDKDKAYWFCKDSGHVIGTSKDASIARENRKIIVLTSKELNKWNDMKDKIMYDILLAKFTQIPIAKQVLLLTHDAILLHGTRMIPISRQYNLEKIRDELKCISV
jgi:ribA/ribD-fused uncharacterized protein